VLVDWVLVVEGWLLVVEGWLLVVEGRVDVARAVVIYLVVVFMVVDVETGFFGFIFTDFGFGS